MKFGWGIVGVMSAALLGGVGAASSSKPSTSQAYRFSIFAHAHDSASVSSFWTCTLSGSSFRTQEKIKGSKGDGDRISVCDGTTLRSWYTKKPGALTATTKPELLQGAALWISQHRPKLDPKKTFLGREQIYTPTKRMYDCEITSWTPNTPGAKPVTEWVDSETGFVVKRISGGLWIMEPYDLEPLTTVPPGSFAPPSVAPKPQH